MSFNLPSPHSLVKEFLDRPLEQVLSDFDEVDKRVGASVESRSSSLTSESACCSLPLSVLTKGVFMSTIYMVYDDKKVRAPVRGYESNSVDLYLPTGEEYLKERVSNKVYRIPLGIRTYMTNDISGLMVLPRSSCSSLPKNVESAQSSTIKLANTVGFIDWDYRGQWEARLQFDGQHKTPTALNYLAFIYLYIIMVITYHASVIERSFTKSITVLTYFYSIVDRMRSINQVVDVNLRASKPLLQVILPAGVELVITPNLSDVPTDLIETTRGSGGFGSSSK